MGQASWPVWLAVAALWSGCGGSASNPKAATEPVPDGGRSVAVRVVMITPSLGPTSMRLRERFGRALPRCFRARCWLTCGRSRSKWATGSAKGQLLVTLESQDLDANVRRTEAAESGVKNSIPEAETGSAVQRPTSIWRQPPSGAWRIWPFKKSISDQEFDEASAHLKAAQAAYDIARAKRTQLDSKLTEVEQEIAAAKIMRGYTQITAPFAGVVTAKSVELGNLAAPGAPLLTLERDGSYRLEASVEESKLAFGKAGQMTEVELEALGRRLSARVSEIVPAVDAASRAYIVKIVPQRRICVRACLGRARFPTGTRSIVAISRQPWWSPGSWSRSS